ncbi:unnamed protein product [Linum tenue]|uniref:Uncharacterized protein n=1 Tax=Linum tenue TaxID=586396 RepID=A0AAV0HTI9_9ROSI|nr:unnamed protein product [Linum tenue]
MSQEPRRFFGRPRFGRMRGVHAFPQHHPHRSHFIEMRRLRLPPQFPPPRTGAAFGGAPSEPEFRLPASDLVLLLPFRPPHAAGSVRVGTRRKPEPESRNRFPTPTRLVVEEAVQIQVHPAPEGADARVRGAGRVEDAEERRGFGAGILQRGQGR